MATKTITVFRFGSPVMAMGGKTLAVVLGIGIRECLHVTYEIAYWCNGARQCCVLEPFEVSAAKDSQTMQITTDVPGV